MGYLDASGLQELWSIIAGSFQRQHKTATVTLAKGASSWTVSASGVTAGNTVVVCPALGSIDEWCECQVRCTAQGAGTLTFESDTALGSDVAANVLILE